MKVPDWKPALSRNRGALALFAFTATVLWFWLGRLNGEVTWLTVEASPRAAIGQPLWLRIQVAGQPSPAVLCADLHWTSDRSSTEGFLAAGTAQSVSKAGGWFDFKITVPPQPEMRFVKAIIYLSPDGNWSNHTFAANTRLIPATSDLAGKATDLVRQPVYQFEESNALVPALPSPWLRSVTGWLWLIGAVFFWRQQNPPRRWWLALTCGMVLAGVWELAGLEGKLGNLTRDLARAQDLYYPRAIFQKAIVSLIIAAAMVLLPLGWNRPPCRLLTLGFGFYLTIALVNLLSLHALDRYAGYSWRGLTVIDALKLLCAVTAIVGLARTKSRNVPGS